MNNLTIHRKAEKGAKYGKSEFAVERYYQNNDKKVTGKLWDPLLHQWLLLM